MKQTQKIFTLTTVFAAMASLMSCVQDDLHETPHPDSGAVTITTDWTDALYEEDIPSTYSLSIDNGTPLETGETTFLYPDLLTPGSHSLLAYNEAQGITIDGTAARVDLLDDGTAEPMPDYLFSAVQDINVPQDDTLRVTLPMKRRVCPVKMVIHFPSGEGVDHLAAADATLSGVAESADLRSGQTGSESVTIRPVLGNVNDNYVRKREYGFALRCRVLGIDATARQTLTITFTMDDGYTRTVTSDLTDYLKDLNSTMEPVEISCTLELPQDGNFSGTIDSWEIASGGDIDAH